MVQWLEKVLLFLFHRIHIWLLTPTLGGLHSPVSLALQYLASCTLVHACIHVCAIPPSLLHSFPPSPPSLSLSGLYKALAGNGTCYTSLVTQALSLELT